MKGLQNIKTMSERNAHLLSGSCGILGTLALMAYFSAPFWLFTLPAPDATVEQVMDFGHEYHTKILWDTWLQQIGSFLTVIFTLSLVHFSGNSSNFFGKLTLLVSGVVLTLSLAEGTFALTALQSGENGHTVTAITCFDLTNVFVHIFLLAPSLFLVMALANIKKSILPKIFVYLALILGILFQTMGVVSLFENTATIAVIFILIAQNIWTLIASVNLMLKNRDKI